MEWADDVGHRPRRANAGGRLQELLANGLDEEEELALRELSDATSDTSFSLSSDEETIDEVESDFSDEEVAGVLDGEDVETDVTLRRGERRERQQQRQRQLQRNQKFSKAAARDREKQLRQLARRQGSPASSDAGSSRSDKEDVETVDLRRAVRQRPAPTTPCAQRLAEAMERAKAVRLAEAEAAQREDGDGGASPVLLHMHYGLNMGKAPQRRAASWQVGQRKRLRGGKNGWGLSDASLHDELVAPSASVVVPSPRIALYEGYTPQRVSYRSGVSVLRDFGVPTVMSFSERLPDALTATHSRTVMK